MEIVLKKFKKNNSYLTPSLQEITFSPVMLQAVPSKNSQALHPHGHT